MRGGVSLLVRGGEPECTDAMPFDGEPTKLLNEAWTNSRAFVQRAMAHSGDVRQFATKAGAFCGRVLASQPLVVWLSSSLTRLIVVSNA